MDSVNGHMCACACVRARVCVIFCLKHEECLGETGVFTVLGLLERKPLCLHGSDTAYSKNLFPNRNVLITRRSEF